VPASPDAVPGVDLSAVVVVALGDRAATSAEDHQVLAHLVARLAGVDAASVALSQDCPTCGASGHGPLRVALAGRADGSPTVHVSLARAGGRVALAVTAAGPVGIDLESVADVGRAPVAAALLSPAEADAVRALPAPAAETALAELWTAKEAVLKAAGIGLRVDPRDLSIRLDPLTAPAGNGDGAEQRRLVEWPQAPFPVAKLHLLPVPAPSGTVITVAVVCDRRPELRIVPLQAVAAEGIRPAENG
jgi:4'-phosphopantetheinyl transferase